MSHFNAIPSGFSYLIQGARWLMKPGMKRFVLVPLCANLLIFFLLTALLIYYFSSVYAWFEQLLNFWSWLEFIATAIATLLSVLVFFIVLLIYGFSFNIITNIIGAPFYGLLAEKIEYKLSKTLPTEETMLGMIARTLRRELIKLWYFLSRSLLVSFGLFFLAFIPLVNLLVPILALSWSAWVMALQYADYPADNNRLSFVELRRRLKQQRWSMLGFGGAIMLGSMIPVLNIFIMPVAVAGGTLFWANELNLDKTQNIR